MNHALAIELHIRFFKKEAQIVEVLYREVYPETLEDTGFTPIGLDEPYRIVVGNSPVNWIDPWGFMKGKGEDKRIWNNIWGFVKNFSGGVADAILPVPPSLADPDAMIAARRLKDAIQDRYDEWGETFNEWGPENPWYYNIGVKTKNNKSYRERLKNCQ